MLTLLLSFLLMVDDSEHVSVHAVMFEMDFDAGGNIRHAQALGGFRSLEDCRNSMPRMMGEIQARIAKGLTPQLICSGVRTETDTQI